MQKKIQVTILNVHGVCSHIELSLTNESVIPNTYYKINRWERPQANFSNKPNELLRFSQKYPRIFAVYSFYIYNEPKIIVKQWQAYFIRTLPQASIVNYNCAVAVQWFLSTFAHIPEPRFASVNHLALGFCIPSSIPIGIMLPGRIMDNAKFHIIDKKPSPVTKQSHLLKIDIALAALKVTGMPAVGAIASSLFLTGNLSMLLTSSFIVTGVINIFGLFNSRQILEIRKQSEESRHNPPVPSQ